MKYRMYGTALVQRHEYTRTTCVVAACGPCVYSRDKLLASSKQLATY